MDTTLEMQQAKDFRRRKCRCEIRREFSTAGFLPPHSAHGANDTVPSYSDLPGLYTFVDDG